MKYALSGIVAFHHDLPFIPLQYAYLYAAHIEGQYLIV
jgi:hypothetical protein